jgi:membrane associated rhomboid family serine protease
MADVTRQGDALSGAPSSNPDNPTPSAGESAANGAPLAAPDSETGASQEVTHHPADAHVHGGADHPSGSVAQDPEAHGDGTLASADRSARPVGDPSATEGAGPPPGHFLPLQHTWIRFGGTTYQIHDAQWPHWVRMNHVPEDALVLSRQWTKGVWRRAASLEVFHLYRPSQDLRPIEEIAPPIPRRGPFGLFRGPGISMTESLMAINVLITVALFLAWRSDYSEQLWGMSEALRGKLFEGWLPVLFIPLFLHANAAHIVSNMIALAGGGTVVEEYYGRKRTLLLYLIAGIAGALLSLTREKPVLSVGASGAIMGMFGVALVFLLRERKHLRLPERWRASRIQLPFLLLLVIPSLFNADLLSHVGGFLGGAAGALFIKPLPGRLSSYRDLTGPLSATPDA